jgi:hypothetical protein
MDPVAGRDQVRATWCLEKQDKVVDMCRCRVASQGSLHVGFAPVHHKTVELLG